MCRFDHIHQLETMTAHEFDNLESEWLFNTRRQKGNFYLAAKKILHNRRRLLKDRKLRAFNINFKVIHTLQTRFSNCTFEVQRINRFFTDDIEQVLFVEPRAKRCVMAQ